MPSAEWQPASKNQPLTVPFLARDTFQHNTQRWLTTLLHQRKHHAIPLHLPTRKLREAAHSTLSSQLHNHRRWEQSFPQLPHEDQLPCGCAHLCQLLTDPQQSTNNGHLIVTLDDLQLPPHLRHFLGANMNSTFFSTKGQSFTAFHKAMTKRPKHHGLLPPTLAHRADHFLATQGQQLLQRLRHEPRFTARSIKQLQQFLGDKVILRHAGTSRILSPDLLQSLPRRMAIPGALPTTSSSHLRNHHATS